MPAIKGAVGLSSLSIVISDISASQVDSYKPGKVFGV